MPGATTQNRLPENELKIASLYKFAKFVQWPEDAKAPIVIGILGQAPFGAAFDEAIKGRKAYVISSRLLKMVDIYTPPKKTTVHKAPQ